MSFFESLDCRHNGITMCFPLTYYKLTDGVICVDLFRPRPVDRGAGSLAGDGVPDAASARVKDPGAARVHLVLVLVLVQLSTVQAGLLLGSLTWRCSSSGRRLIFADGASVKREIFKLYTTFATSIHYIT